MQRARPPTDTILPPLKPIPIKERMSVIFVEKGEIDVVDGAFVVVDCLGERVRPVLTHIPVGGVACIMLEPGTRVSHRAAALAARVGTLLVWVGVHFMGVPHARGEELLLQAFLPRLRGEVRTNAIAHPERLGSEYRHPELIVLQGLLILGVRERETPEVRGLSWNESSGLWIACVRGLERVGALLRALGHFSCVLFGNAEAEAQEFRQIEALLGGQLERCVQYLLIALGHVVYSAYWAEV